MWKSHPRNLVLAAGLMLGVNSCDGAEPPAKAYAVSISIKGTAAAFAGRKVVVGARNVEAIDYSTPSAPNHRAEASLCTHDLDNFLHKAVTVRVYEGDKLLSESRIDRVACALSPEGPGRQEMNVVVLRADGTIDAEFGKGPDVYAACSTPSWDIVCPDETL